MASAYKLVLILILYHTINKEISLASSEDTKDAHPSIDTSILTSQDTKHHNNSEAHGIHLASWRWDEYWKLVTFCLIIICAGIFKLAFHHATWLSWLPESCVLIIIGIVIGGVIYHGEDAETIENDLKHPFPHFTAFLFFNILLPPIILDSSYSLYNRDFFDNIGSIMSFAIIGTLFNVFTVAYSLYFVNYLGKDQSFSHIIYLKLNWIKSFE